MDRQASNMSQDKVSSSGNETMVDKPASFRPTVNWNQASGSGIRTGFLRRSKSTTNMGQGTASSSAIDNEYPVVIIEREFSPVSVSEDNESSRGADNDVSEQVPAIPDPGCHLYVSNVPPGIKKDDLVSFFREFTIKSYSIPASRQAAYVYITLAKSIEATRAVIALKHRDLLGRKVNVAFARANSIRFTQYLEGDYVKNQTASNSLDSANSVVESTDQDKNFDSTVPTEAPPPPENASAMINNNGERRPTEASTSPLDPVSAQLQSEHSIQKQRYAKPAEAIASTSGSDRKSIQVPDEKVELLHPEDVPLPDSIQPTNEHSEDSDAISPGHNHTDSSDEDGEIVLNLEDDTANPSIAQQTNSVENTPGDSETTTHGDSNGPESGEVSSLDGNSVGSSGEIEEDTHSNGNEVINIESDDDAMVSEYSNAHQHPKPVDTSRPSKDMIEIIDLEDTGVNGEANPQEQDTTIPGPRTLAELTPAQLEIQVRYFYVARDPNTIPETDPVHCTVCSGASHLAPWCPAHTCEHCNAKGLHFSRQCPKIGRCSRCRGVHSITDCELKLKPLKLTVICDMCHESGHIEADCELNWRSSGTIWKQPLPPLSVAKTCFNCGDSGHLGNDCRLRRPGKPMGSSMWSAKGLPEPFTPLIISADRPVHVAPISRKERMRMPNSKAKGVSAPVTRNGDDVRQSHFIPVNKPGTKNSVTKIKGAASKGNIQIKGLASRAGLGGPSYSTPQNQQDYRVQQNTSYSRDAYSNQQSRGHFGSDHPYSDNSSGGFQRGRNGDGRYRSRSRSRSPRGRYRSPPRNSGYGYSSREYRDRDDSRYPSDTWRPGGR